MPTIYIWLLTMAALVGTIAVVLRVRWVDLINNIPTYPLRFAWDGPVAAVFWLTAALWFCLVPPERWHSLAPSIAVFTLWFIGPLAARLREKTLAKKKDT